MKCEFYISVSFLHTLYPQRSTDSSGFLLVNNTETIKIGVENCIVFFHYCIIRHFGLEQHEDERFNDMLIHLQR